MFSDFENTIVLNKFQLCFKKTFEGFSKEINWSVGINQTYVYTFYFFKNILLFDLRPFKLFLEFELSEFEVS